MREMWPDEDIDGVFIANDQMSVGALRAISEAGRRVPDDIKVIGYDDVFIASVMETPLSTIHIRKRHMGIEAARLLLARIQRQANPMPPRRVELNPAGGAQVHLRQRAGGLDHGGLVARITFFRCFSVNPHFFAPPADFCGRPEVFFSASGQVLLKNPAFWCQNPPSNYTNSSSCPEKP
jgi:hypothetical protein